MIWTVWAVVHSVRTETPDINLLTITYKPHPLSVLREANDGVSLIFSGEKKTSSNYLSLLDI